MNQAELAAAAGVSEPTVSHAMAGRQVSYLTIRKFARVLTITPVLLGSEGIIGAQRSDASASPSQASVAEASCGSASAN
jgi:transcriptional regulator with XRE-family HTH domain